MSTTTRDRILAAALACFTDSGYERTTVAVIRERSGVSNGALFHHFPSKEAIAGALYVDAMRSVQEGHWALLRRRPRSLRAAVRGMIAHQLEWTAANADRARFVYGQGHLESGSPAGKELAELNERLARAYRDWMAPFVERSEVRPMSMLMLTAIVTGSAHAIAQRWLAGQVDAPLASYVDELADAAATALTGAPATSRRAASRSPHKARVRLELLADDGSVLAEGEASAELAAPRTDRR